MRPFTITPVTCPRIDKAGFMAATVSFAPFNKSVSGPTRGVRNASPPCEMDDKKLVHDPLSVPAAFSAPPSEFFARAWNTSSLLIWPFETMSGSLDWSTPFCSASHL